jgi:hypothetical protein
MCPTTTLVGLLPVAVSAAHFALGYLDLYLLYAVPQTNGIRYTELLVVAYMVKLKHDDVRLTAIYAGVGLEVVVYIGAYAHAGYLTVHFCLSNDLITMLRVVPAARFSTFLDVVERHGWCI